MLKRTFLTFLVALPLLAAANPKVQVYKTATCGCCKKWVDHLRTNGFEVTVTDVPSTGEYRKKYGVPETLMSCHTAVVDGYAVEGHVPAADVERLLKTHPKGKGIAVPGMPLGSPGMEQGAGRQAYSVLLFQADGTSSEFQKYSAK
ncbi:MAG: DUF411 domain-containing protein [Bryobacteraceae bacterium]